MLTLDAEIPHFCALFFLFTSTAINEESSHILGKPNDNEEKHDSIVISGLQYIKIRELIAMNCVILGCFVGGGCEWRCLPVIVDGRSGISRNQGSPASNTAASYHEKKLPGR